MRVAVIAPPYPLEEAPAPPLGVCYVAAAFEAAGCEVRIFDFVVNGYSREKLRRWMEEFNPHVVGSTSVTMNFPQAIKAIEDAKKIDPAVLTIMGGPHVSFCAPETLNQHPELDLVVLGEGELTIAELAPELKNRNAWKNIPGLAFFSGNDVTETLPRPLNPHLDSLPLPARHLLPLSRYKALGFPVSLITSRGCPNKCIFCLGRRMVGHKVRYRDTALVADEIEGLLSMGFERINIADDLFTSNKQRVGEFCQTVKDRGLKFGWSAFARVNTVDDRTVAMMADAGCDCISFGIESGSPEMLKRIRKGITLGQAKKAIKACKNADVMAHASFMVGLPGETKQTLADTQAFAKDLDIVYGYHFLAPFPGTTVYEDIDDFDLEILTRDWGLYDANRPVVRTKEVSPQDQMDLVASYEAECDQDWQSVLKDYEEGTLEPLEELQVEGKKRLDLIYDILIQDLIITHGNLPENLDNNIDGALKHLCGQVARATGRDPQIVAATLEYFARRQYIILRKDKRSLAWGWAANP